MGWSSKKKNVYMEARGSLEKSGKKREDRKVSIITNHLLLLAKAAVSLLSMEVVEDGDI